MKVTFPDSRVVIEGTTTREKGFLLKTIGDFYATMKVAEGGVKVDGTPYQKHKKHVFKKPCPVCGKMFKGVKVHMHKAHKGYVLNGMAI